MRRKSLSVGLLMLPLMAAAQSMVGGMLVQPVRQVNSAQKLPAGDYSGICHMEGSRYVLVDDKSADGFRVVDIDIDRRTGEVVQVQDLGFRGQNSAGRDAEGVAVVGQHVYVAGEKDHAIMEYDLAGKQTGLGRVLPVTRNNLGYESLTYDSAAACFWTCAEQPNPGDSVTRLFCLDHRLQMVGERLYRMDMPRYTVSAEQVKGGVLHVHGISELLAVGDSAQSLLVLEREAYVPKKKIGARVVSKLYRCATGGQQGKDKTDVLQKTLVSEWETKLNVTNRSFANYEGMCWGPRLEDGRRVILLVSDSQHRYKGVLKDWFKTLIVSD